jgi:hypothetical protein
MYLQATIAGRSAFLLSDNLFTSLLPYNRGYGNYVLLLLLCARSKHNSARYWGAQYGYSGGRPNTYIAREEKTS